MNDEQKKSIKEEVMQEIHSGRFSMRSRSQVILHTALVTAGVAIIFIVAVYIVSFIVSTLRRTGVWYAPAFGSDGWREFFYSFPWVLVLLALLFIVLLSYVTRRYAIVYRHPLIYSSIALVLISIAGGLVFAQAPFNRFIFRMAERRLPMPPGGFYHGLGVPNNNVHPGSIISIMNQGFEMQDQGGRSFQILLDARTRFPLGMDFEPGDTVIVFGRQSSGTIHAIGVREVPETEFDFPQPMHRGMMRFPSSSGF